MARRSFSTSHKAIFEYWKNKAIKSDGTIIEDDYSIDSIPVVYDWGEPRCFACGKYGCDCDKFADESESGIIWNNKETKSKLQRCHIVAQSLGGSDDADNLFLMCEKCHRESPDTIYPKMFFKWVYKKRNKQIGCDWLETALKELRDDYDITIPLVNVSEFLKNIEKYITCHCGISDETMKSAFVGYALQKQNEFYEKIRSDYE